MRLPLFADDALAYKVKVALVLTVAVLLAAPLFADDPPADRARKVKVALALAEAKAEPVKKDAARATKVALALELAGQPSPPAFVTIPTVAPAPMPRLKCECDTTGECKCPPGGCTCCEKPLPDFATQAKLAVRIGKPLVCYVGCKGHCLDGALACETKADAGDPPGVEVLIPNARGNLTECFRLPCDAGPEAIRAAVQSAAKALAAQPKSPATPAKVSSRTVVPAGMHAHVRADGTVIVHGDENVGNPVAHTGVPWPWPKAAVGGQFVPCLTGR